MIMEDRHDNEVMLRTIPGLIALSILLTGLLPAQTPAREALGIGLEGYPYPYPVKFLSLRIESQDLRMAYMDVPPKGQPNGRTVVLMHGKNFGSYYWAGVIGELANGRQVAFGHLVACLLTPLCPRYGESARAQG